jgi:peptidoglycan/xylan/chitin deacetylase (PgdA/CDA1 family)/CelD/BcsL family acetyltransferase involved in cellulose biosynthesis
MKIVEIQHEAELHGLNSAWAELLRDSASDTIFLTWDWLARWWSIYGQPGDLRILAAFDDHNVLRGIAPLRSKQVRRYGQTVPALTFVGDGSNDSDYLDFIVATGYEDPVHAAFRRHLQEDLRRGTVLLLNEIPESSPNLPFLRELSGGQDLLSTESEVPCGTVLLPQSWDDYLRLLKPRFRTKVRSVLRSLEGRPEVHFGFCNNADQVARLLPVLFDLHTSRWAEDGKPGVFRWDCKRDFYHVVSASLLDRGWLRLAWLEWNGQILACQYGFRYNGTYFHLQEGYEPAAEHWNLGVGLRAWSIREFIREGVKEYDFLGGVGRHKLDWGCQVKNSKQVLIAGATFKNRLVARGPAWETQAKDFVKRFLPQELLDARRRIAQKQPAAPEQHPTGQPPAASRNSWLRKSAANCYLYSGLPALVRPLRNQYQLSRGTPHSQGRVSWDRRTNPAARILYYHRVNDDADPFFPAITTTLFEQQMSFLARHYKVVGMAELLDHLQNGSPEPVLAITFDDGYQDNYANALPILERYGLPATIFLSTGAIDSREPLWFEQLALALKKTDRAYLDIEVDIPRRFPLRTQQERLKANDAIFALLRALPNVDRTRYLDELLRQSGVVDDPERRNRMLTWEQIRLMTTRGITFGGHTVSHPFISKLPADQVTWEVSECKRRIEDQLQRPADYFAYPNGREQDFGAWNKDLIRAAGYKAAVTTIWGMNYRSTDPMELRRGGPWEQTAAQFAYKLDWYQLVND